MKKSRVFTLGLVGFLTAVTAFSTLATTSGGGGALLRNLSDNSAHSEASLSGQNATQNAGGAATENGHLNLSPETDKVVYTTATGIEIKSHNLSASGAESSIQYFTLGAYNGTPVNWLIVGASNQMAENATDAGALINAAAGNGKLVTGATSSDLLENQILCISEYAFNQEEYNPNYKEHAQVYFSPTRRSEYSFTTDQFTDYYESYTALHDIASASLVLGTILGINGYYGSGIGKIVNNSAFSNNYVFSLSSSHYTTFVGLTNYKIPYMFTSTSTAVNIWSNNASTGGVVTSTCTARGSNWLSVSGSGAAYATLNNVVSSTGVVSNIKVANFTASAWSGSDYIATYYAFYTSYSVTNNPISIAYRPAFVMQL